MAETERAERAALLFVEEVAVAFEQAGFPRMAGRVVGWLLICDPPEQTSTQLSEVLHASKGSISTATRLLISSGLVQRRSLPRDRRDYFRLRPEAWPRLVRARLAEASAFRDLTERGLRLLSGDGPGRVERLEDVHRLYAWLERELVELWDRWERQNGATSPPAHRGGC